MGYVAAVIDVVVLGWALVTERRFPWDQEPSFRHEQRR
jgi:hypothetical protein